MPNQLFSQLKEKLINFWLLFSKIIVANYCRSSFGENWKMDFYKYLEIGHRKVPFEGLLLLWFPKRFLSFFYLAMLCFSWQLLFVIQAHNRTAEKCNGSTLKQVSLLMCKLYNLQSKALSTIFACVELNSTGVWGSARVVSLALLSWFSSQCNVIDDGNEIRVSLATEYKLKQKRV